MIKNSLIIIFFLLIHSRFYSQVTILNSMFNAFNVGEEALLYANIMNAGDQQEVHIEAKLYNGLNQPVLSVKSKSFILKNGVTNTAQLILKSNSAEYANNNDANYIKTMHQLPSGKFRYCLFVIPTMNNEGADLCEEFDNEANTFLFLINPSDRDTIESKTPILLWNHSDPFNILKQGEMYRLVVVDIKDGQGADAAINVNYPILKLDFLTRHDIQYPFDGYKLLNGKKYGWQVQKVINNVVVNKTEAWEFVIKPELEQTYNKYVEIRPGANSSTYLASGNKIFFTFNEEYYTSNKKLNITITPENKVALKNIQVKEDTKLNQNINSKEVGENKYEIDLNELAIENGYYYLNITNEKGRSYQLKFYVNN